MIEMSFSVSINIVSAINSSSSKPRSSGALLCAIIRAQLIALGLLPDTD